MKFFSNSKPNITERNIKSSEYLTPNGIQNQNKNENQKLKFVSTINPQKNSEYLKNSRVSDNLYSFSYNKNYDYLSSNLNFVPYERKNNSYLSDYKLDYDKKDFLPYDKLANEKRNLEIQNEKLQSDLRKIEFLEQELQSMSAENKSLQFHCDNLKRELAFANKQITENNVYKSRCDEIEVYKTKYEKLLMEMTELKKQFEFLERRNFVVEEERKKNELLLQSYESQNINLQKEVKNLNESLADKENYIFELKNSKQQMFKIDHERQTQENEFRLNQKINEQNQEIERLMMTVREITKREKKWDDLQMTLREKDFQILRLNEEKANLHNIIENLQYELQEKTYETRKIQEIDEINLQNRIRDNQLEILQLQTNYENLN